MTPHRIGPLLCATFLVLAGAASADQTWTTAWTPDSAPAKRDNTGQEQDHSYKTNCYPCKRWDPGADSGRGAMINDPTNAAPRTCRGDTTETSARRLSGNHTPHQIRAPRRNSRSDVLDGRPGSAEVEYCRLQINREFEQVWISGVHADGHHAVTIMGEYECTFAIRLFIVLACS